MYLAVSSFWRSVVNTFAAFGLFKTEANDLLLTEAGDYISTEQ